MRENISFHLLPDNENLKPKWIKVIYVGYEEKKCKKTD